MLFSVLSKELLDVLELLRPFPQKVTKDDFDCMEEDDEDVPKPIVYKDKVFFELAKGYVSISVFNRNIRITREINAIVEEEKLRFCMSFFELIRKIPTDERILEFHEVRFFGFEVYEVNAGERIFEIEAFPWGKGENPIPGIAEFPFKEAVSLEKDFFIDSLSQISVFGDTDSWIGYRISNDSTRVWSSRKSMAALYSYPVTRRKMYLFFISNKFALGSIPIIDGIVGSSIRIYYNEENLLIQEDSISIMLKQPKNYSTEFLDRILSIRDFVGHFFVSRNKVIGFLNRSLALIDSNDMGLYIRVVEGYMTIHCYDDIRGLGIREVFSTTNGSGVFNLKLNRASFAFLLNNLETDIVGICLSEDGYIHFLNEGEEVIGDRIRLIRNKPFDTDEVLKMEKESNELIEEWQTREIEKEVISPEVIIRDLVLRVFKRLNKELEYNVIDGDYYPSSFDFIDVLSIRYDEFGSLDAINPYVENVIESYLELEFDKLSAKEKQMVYSDISNDDSCENYSVDDKLMDTFLEMLEEHYESDEIQKYVDGDYEDDDNDKCDDDNEEVTSATLKEMREEAVSRMRVVIDCKTIIDDFRKTGDPQVYEPPYGAGYYLEKEELERIREIESTSSILVWGVIRSFMTFDGYDETVDCLLFVSSNKEDWEQERSDLFDGIPFVFAMAKEAGYIDFSHITVIKSPGGTLLRKLNGN